MSFWVLLAIVVLVLLIAALVKLRRDKQAAYEAMDEPSREEPPAP
jgi:hypothetical protein